MNWHSMSIEKTLKALNTSQTQGLSSKEAAKRLKKYGYNILEKKKEKNLIIKFISQFADFMIIILMIAAAISFFVSLLEGHADYIDPFIILAIIFVNAFLGVLQEAKAEKSLEALQKMSAPIATVLRDSSYMSIPAKELVPGDIIRLETGHYIPADARLITSVNLKVDESALTGESVPCEKEADLILKEETLLADRKNLVPATGITTYGRGTAVVVATGMYTEVGHIAKLIMEDVSPATPLQKRLEQTGKILGIVAMLICVLLFIIGVFNERPIFEMFMTSVSLAVAAIPEGLPAIVTIMLSLGVQRMAKNNAIIRRLPAVETLGSATIICSDKTGTLTQNKMTVTKIASCAKEEPMNSEFSSFILTLASQCNDTIIHTDKKKTTATGEPTERALTVAAQDIGINKAKLDFIYKRIFEIPFDSTRKRMTTLHQLDTSYRSITKGALDVLLPLCTYAYQNGKIVSLTDSIRSQINKQNQYMSEQALRVIAVTYKDLSSDISPRKFASNDKQLEQNLIFVGLIGLIDPPRPEAKSAVLTCKIAGIKPVMITGDHILTASAIGRELGILSSHDESITGAQLNQMDDDVLIKSIHKYSVFARVSPEHKVRIVKAFQKQGEIVAMTGDGVNDAPALKAADIGCAMGMTGTDVAKNAADMILIDDNFATIVSAIKEGRGIYENIKRSIHFLLSCNIGEIITIFTAILFGFSSPLKAVQLLWVNLVTDSLPAISLGVEPPQADIMKKKPIPPNKGMFSDGLAFRIIVEGFLIGFLSLTAYILGSKYITNHSQLLGTTMCFAVLSLSQLFHSFNMRSNHSLLQIGIFSNWKLLVSFIICAFLQVIVISVPSLAKIFKVISLELYQWIIVIFLSIVPIIVIELQKHSNRR